MSGDQPSIWEPFSNVDYSDGFSSPFNSQQEGMYAQPSQKNNKDGTGTHPHKHGDGSTCKHGPGTGAAPHNHVDGSACGHDHGTEAHSHSHDLKTYPFGYNPLWWLPILLANFCIVVFNWGRDKYKTYWVPFLFAFGKVAFGGREHAGNVAWWCKSIRIAAMAVSLVSLYLLIDMMSWSDFKASGGEMPMWSSEGVTNQIMLSWIGFAAMSINMLAVFVGSAANHHKIQQYMERREQVGNITGKSICCGVDDTPSMKLMNGARYAHDANGFTGSVLSCVVFMSFGGSMLGVDMGIGTSSLFAMFVARTVSFVVSVTLAPVTGKYRLNEYKKDLVGNMETHMSKHNDIDSCFKHITLTNEIKQFKFSCYRACEKHFGSNKWTNAEAAVNLVIGTYIKDNQINRQAIESRVGMRIPLIDAMNFIQLEVEAALKGKNDLTFIPKENPGQYGSSARLMLGAMQVRDQAGEELQSKCVKDKWTTLYEVNTNSAKTKIQSHGIDARGAMVVEGRI